MLDDKTLTNAVETILPLVWCCPFKFFALVAIFGCQAPAIFGCQARDFYY
jgi:hypothetical protein